MIHTCPLCQSEKTQKFHQMNDKSFGIRLYFDCSICGLIFLDQDGRLSNEQERARYELHENNPEDERYVDFLKILLTPLMQYLSKNAQGLDFGCGPGPATSKILRTEGFSVEDYDPIFKPKNHLLEQKYDFIACSEVVEHFYDPFKEFRLLDRLLKKGGVLGIMTQVYHDDVDFTNWAYQREPTHVCFFRDRTLDWIAKCFKWSMDCPHRNVVIYFKP